MKHCIAAAFIIALALASGASAQLLESLVVPTDGSSASSTTVLTAGVPYELRVSGTFNIGGPGDGLADSEYANFSNPPSSLLDFSGSVDLGVLIDGNKPIWGTFEPSHVYSLGFVGIGSTLAASYNDTFFGDNSGALTLEIFAVPEPSTCVMLVLVGCSASVLLRRQLSHS